MTLPRHPRALLRRLWLVAACAAAPACSADAAPGDGWQADREVRGDTTIVTTTSGSVWSEASLVEELRIGTLDGAEEYIFGGILALTPDGGGGVYAFDGQVPALRHYDSTGAYVGTIGGKGAGPGEYQDAVLGMAVRPDGRLMLRDARNSRLNLYDPDGKPSDHWRVADGLFTSDALLVDTAGHSYLKILLEPPERNRPWKIGLLHLDETGAIVDSIEPPTIVGEPTDGGGTFIPGKLWARSPHGFTVVGVPRAYEFEVRHPDARVVRVRRPHTPVALLPEEKAELEAQADWMRENQGQFLSSDIPDIPGTKPAYAEIRAAADGRIWVRRHVTAVKQGEEEAEPDPGRPPRRLWREPSVYDVFEADGTYLGEVRLPDRMRISWIGREHVWAVHSGEMDESYIVRLRLVAR